MPFGFQSVFGYEVIKTCVPKPRFETFSGSWEGHAQRNNHLAS